MKSSKIIVDENTEGAVVGQGELYSPEHAIKISSENQHNTAPNDTTNEILKESIHHHQNNNHHHQNHEDHQEAKGDTMVGKGVANDIKNKMSMVKERLMEKLAAASVPSDAVENARHYFESVIKDVTSAAQGITKEALQRIKSHLADILPSLSPSLTSKMVDDAEKEATPAETREDDGCKDKETEDNQEHRGKAYVTPASSFFSNILPLKPTSKL